MTDLTKQSEQYTDYIRRKETAIANKYRTILAIRDRCKDSIEKLEKQSYDDIFEINTQHDKIITALDIEYNSIIEQEADRMQKYTLIAQKKLDDTQPVFHTNLHIAVYAIIKHHNYDVHPYMERFTNLMENPKDNRAYDFPIVIEYELHNDPYVILSNGDVYKCGVYYSYHSDIKSKDVYIANIIKDKPEDFRRLTDLQSKFEN